MEDRKIFVRIVNDILKGNVPSDFYATRERLNQSYSLGREQNRATRAMIDATSEAAYLTGTKGTRLYEDLERDREARRDRLAEFVFCERIYIACEKTLMATTSFLLRRKTR